ncbi:MAG: transketolase, partial [Bacteriovoracaceae bacterium]|nr:transketolase [Bacteriovoracaceae bacterium]
IKGYGVKSTSESASGGHGFPLKKGDGKLESFIQEIYQDKAPEEFVTWAREISPPPASASTPSSAPKKEKIQVGISKALNWAAEQKLPVFSVSADLQGSTGLADFHKKFPENFVEVGVAESNMINTAAGLSKMGFIPIVDTFAQFGVTKGLLPLTMASLSQAPVIAVFSHTGFQDAADGASHQATTYISATASIPNTTLIVCASSSEAEFFMKEAVSSFHKRKENILFFIGREDFLPTYNESYAWKKATCVFGDIKNHDVTLVTCGPLVPKALKTAELLANDGIKVCVINNSFVNHPDVSLIGQAVKNSGKLITVEDHQKIAGMGQILSHSLLEAGFNFKLRSLGIQGEFGQSAYVADDLYAKHGLDEKEMIKAIKELL